MSMQLPVDHESEESQVLQHGCSMASRETDQHTIHTAFEEANVKRFTRVGPARPASSLADAGSHVPNCKIEHFVTDQHDFGLDLKERIRT
jgi:hypothetical protein